MSGVTHDGKGWSNADQDRVELVAYDPSWPAQYEAEAGAIRAALAGLADFELAHFGSTAIPGLAAKPILDIMLISADQSPRSPVLRQGHAALRHAAHPSRPRPHPGGCEDRPPLLRASPPSPRGGGAVRCAEERAVGPVPDGPREATFTGRCSSISSGASWH